MAERFGMRFWYMQLTYAIDMGAEVRFSGRCKGHFDKPLWWCAQIFHTPLAEHGKARI